MTVKERGGRRKNRRKEVWKEVTQTKRDMDLMVRNGQRRHREMGTG